MTSWQRSWWFQAGQHQRPLGNNCLIGWCSHHPGQYPNRLSQWMNDMHSRASAIACTLYCYHVYCQLSTSGCPSCYYSVTLYTTLAVSLTMLFYEFLFKKMLQWTHLRMKWCWKVKIMFVVFLLRGIQVCPVHYLILLQLDILSSVWKSFPLGNIPTH